MPRALIAIDTASCRAHDGDRAEAARIAAQVYGALPASYRTGLTRTRVLALYRTLPTDTPGIDTLADALALAS